MKGYVCISFYIYFSVYIYRFVYIVYSHVWISVCMYVYFIVYFSVHINICVYIESLAVISSKEEESECN